MTRFKQFDKALAERGWTYDSAKEEFRDGARRVGWRELVPLLPYMTLDELASYVDDRHDKLRAGK